jgi:predicted GH43/DUF377 family glycosyl hydrolase
MPREAKQSQFQAQRTGNRLRQVIDHWFLQLIVDYALLCGTLVTAPAIGGEPLPANDLLEAPRFVHIPGPNPILTPATGWDQEFLEASDAIKDGNTYYLYYHAKGNLGYQIGVATSQNPLGPFKRHGDQPLLGIGPPGSWDDKYVACAFILKERSNKYYMFYSAKKEGRDRQLGRNVYDIGMATADNPLGPWTKHPENPLIPDFGFVGSVVKRDGRYWMFNSAPLGGGGEDYAMLNRDYGPLSVATADRPEGPWRIHPEPVMRQGEPGEWDDAGISEAEVVYHTGLFHLFYGATARAPERRKSLESIGYAYSNDGLNWHKYGRNPVASRAAEPNVSSYAEVHAIFEAPFIYLYHTMRYETIPEHAQGRSGQDWLEDIGVQVIATQRPFSLDMPIMNLDLVEPRQTTTMSLTDSKTLSLGNIARANLTVAGRFEDVAHGGIRIHVRSSPDGTNYDTKDLQTFDIDAAPGQHVRQTFPLDSSVRFIRVLIENLDDDRAVHDVQITASLKG